MRPEFDERDAEIVLARQAARRRLDSITSCPREGDAIQYPDGSIRYVTFAFHDGCQTTVPGADASFHLNEGGGMSFSGSLDRSIPRKQLKLVEDRYQPARAWIFHHGHVQAHTAVPCTVDVRLWLYNPE